MKNIFKDEKKYLFALALILVARIVLHILLYKNGFESLSADEFGRIVRAAHWAKDPHLFWHGPWLPFHTYLFGTALRIFWDMLYVPRVIAILFGLASIVLMYYFAGRLFNSKEIGLISAIVLAVNPAHIWLSSVPLDGIIFTTIILSVLLTFILYIRSKKLYQLYLSSGLLLIANGFRYEAWMVSIPFSLYLIIWSIHEYNRNTVQLKQTLTIIGAALLPWIIPATWIINSYLITGDILSFISSVSAYKSKWYGTRRSFLPYWQTFFKLDPLTTILGLIGIWYGFFQIRYKKEVQWALLIVTVSFLIFLFLHRGQIEPTSNYIRYMASFQFFLIPFVSILISDLATKVIPSQSLRCAVIVLLITVFSILQINTALNFQDYPGKDPASQGLLPGIRFRSIRDASPKKDKNVLLELSYWQYLAFNVGANDVSSVIYDRKVDTASRATNSIFLEDLQTINKCIGENDIGYIVVKSPELIDFITSGLSLNPVEKVNEYCIFQVPIERFYRFNANVNCPLEESKR
jgi:hypothetical protein